MRKKKKFSIILAGILFGTTLFVGLILVGNANFENTRIFNERIENDLLTIARINSKHTGILLREFEEKMIILADVDFPSDALAKINAVLSDEDLEGLEHELEELLEVSEDDFDELFILNLRGEVVAATNSDSIGELFDLKVFAPNSGEAKISEVYYSDVLRENVISISSNIIDDNEKRVAGILVGNMNLSLMAEIVSAEGLGETGESYLLNSEGFFLTPSRFLRGENRGVLTQQVDTENIRECFVAEGGEVDDHPVYHDYLDYRGEKVFGAHFPVDETNWCLVVQIDADEIFEISRDVFLKNQISVALILLLTMTFFGFYVGRFFDKKNAHISFE